MTDPAVRATHKRTNLFHERTRKILEVPTQEFPPDQRLVVLGVDSDMAAPYDVDSRVDEPAPAVCRVWKRTASPARTSSARSARLLVGMVGPSGPPSPAVPYRWLWMRLVTAKKPDCPRYLRAGSIPNPQTSPATCSNPATPPPVAVETFVHTMRLQAPSYRRGRRFEDGAPLRPMSPLRSRPGGEGSDAHLFKAHRRKVVPRRASPVFDHRTIVPREPAGQRGLVLAARTASGVRGGRRGGEISTPRSPLRPTSLNQQSLDS